MSGGQKQAGNQASRNGCGIKEPAKMNQHRLDEEFCRVASVCLKAESTDLLEKIPAYCRNRRIFEEARNFREHRQFMIFPLQKSDQNDTEQ